MNDILKQRLIGALILLALGVVFWPIIFVQPEHKGVPSQSAPPRPAVSTDAIEPPDATGLRTSPDIAAASQAEIADADAISEEPAAVAAPSATVQAVQPPAVASQGASQSTSKGAAQGTAHGVAPGTAQNAASMTRTAAPQKLAMDANGVPQAWTLQVATVSSEEKGEELRKRLIAMQQKAYVTAVSSGGNRLYRVCIGPKFERAELAAIQSRINAEFGVTTMIVRYTP